MPRAKMLALTLLMRDSLTDNIPALIDEINNEAEMPEYQIENPPEGITLGIGIEMINRPKDKLPAVACGIYTREPVMEGEQEFSEVVYDYVVNIYLADIDSEALFVKSQKWVMVMDLWVERYASNLIRGFTSPESASIDVSYVLEDTRKKLYKQLISVDGSLHGME